jgi:hypothetical protein
MSKRILADSKRVLRRFDRALNRFKRRIENVAQLSCYVSPSLESTLYEGARIKLLARVAAALPACGLVDNIVSGHCVPGTICERHGIDPGSTLPCIADLDGLDGRTIDLATYKKNAAQCILKFYWEPALNCIKESFVLPNERICTVRKTLFTRLGDICRFLRA